jgi:hypothetical protein
MAPRGLAQNNLGLMYANGEGVPQDYGKARFIKRKDARLLDIVDIIFACPVYSCNTHKVLASK